MGWDRAALLFDGCAVFTCGRACAKRLWGGFATCSRTAWAFWKWSCSVPRVLFKVFRLCFLLNVVFYLSGVPGVADTLLPSWFAPSKVRAVNSDRKGFRKGPRT